MADRSVILQTCASACQAVCGIAALFGMMAQLVEPGLNALTWITGGFLLAGVGGMILLCMLAERRPGQPMASAVAGSVTVTDGPRFVELPPPAATQAELKPGVPRAATETP